MDEEELSETIQKRAEELKRHAKPENREQDKEQDSEEQLDFQPQTVAEQTNAGDVIRLESLSKYNNCDMSRHQHHLDHYPTTTLTTTTPPPLYPTNTTLTTTTPLSPPPLSTQLNYSNKSRLDLRGPYCFRGHVYNYVKDNYCYHQI